MASPAVGRLFIMAKEPRLGRVKTRLGSEIGPAAATRFSRCTTANLIRRLARDRRWRTVLAVAPDGAVVSPFWPADVARAGQGPGDLGQRMRRLLAWGGSGPTVLVGSDIPGIRASHIAEAFALLRRHQVVFGPAEDGGFWLIGVNSRTRLLHRSNEGGKLELGKIDARQSAGVPAGIFDGVRWSSPHALADTLKKVAGLRVALAATLADVDDAASYRRAARMGARVTPPWSPAAR